MAALNAALFASIVARAGTWAAADRDSISRSSVRRPTCPLPTTALYIVGLNVFGFFAVAMLGGSLAERARRADVELEQATEAIADLQAFNQFVIDSLLSGLATADAQNRLLTLNRSAMAIMGLSGELPIGRPIAEVLTLDPAIVATIDEDLQRARSKRARLRVPASRRPRHRRRAQHRQPAPAGRQRGAISTPSRTSPR